jgi:hypothetical protein
VAEVAVVVVPQVLQTRSQWAVQQVAMPEYLSTFLAPEMKRA